MWNACAGVYGKVGIIADNAGALTGREMRKCLDYAGGDVEMLHLPPHTPQLNPIEVEWREIKAGHRRHLL